MGDRLLVYSRCMWSATQANLAFYLQQQHPFNRLPRWAGTRKVKPMWILLKQETVGGSGISWTVCKSAPLPRQIPAPAPHHSIFYRLDALRGTQPTMSKHWRKAFYYQQNGKWVLSKVRWCSAAGSKGRCSLFCLWIKCMSVPCLSALEMSVRCKALKKSMTLR